MYDKNLHSSFADVKNGKGTIQSDPDCIKQFFLKRYGELADCLSDDSLQEKYGKRDGPLNWVTVRKLMKKELLTDLTKEWNEFWDEQELSEKFRLLNKLKNSTKDANPAWYPKTGDISRQRRILDKKFLLALKENYTSIAVEREAINEKLKEKVAGEWDRLRQVELQVQQHNKQNVVLRGDLENRLHRHFHMEMDEEKNVVF